MTWEILNMIGSIAFALSGAIVAMREDYNLIGVYFLGYITAFGGGAIRNLLLGVPVSELWGQGEFFVIALVSMTVMFYFPNTTLKQWRKLGNISDAIGLAAFSVQGALIAKSLGHPSSAIIVAAILTGVGGGIIRDILARRQPYVFKYDLYAFWALVGGVLVAFVSSEHVLMPFLFVAIVLTLRLMALKYKWSLPRYLSTNHALKDVKEE